MRRVARFALGLLAAVFVTGLAPGRAEAADPWPAEPYDQAVDLTSLVPGTASGFGNQLSDVFWNEAKRQLWVARAPGGVWTLAESGGAFFVNNQYPTIDGDSEGITQADLLSDSVFVLDESGDSITRYDAPAANALTAPATLHERWRLGVDARVTPNLPAVVPAAVSNAGPEGLAFVPDEFLARSGFVASTTDLPFPASQKGFGGLFFVAHQAGGFVYAVDLNPADEHDRALVGKYKTSRTESSALAFDQSTGHLFVSHNTGGNFLEVVDLASTAVSPGVRQLVMLGEYEAPNGSNLEGFAMTPAFASPGVAGEGWCFYCDDDGNTGFDSKLHPYPGLMWFKDCASIALTGVSVDAGTLFDGSDAASASDAGVDATADAGIDAAEDAGPDVAAGTGADDGGCSCRTTRGHRGEPLGWPALAAAVLAVRRRRRR